MDERDRFDDVPYFPVLSDRKVLNQIHIQASNFLEDGVNNWYQPTVESTPTDDHDVVCNANNQIAWRWSGVGAEETAHLSPEVLAVSGVHDEFAKRSMS